MADNENVDRGDDFNPTGEVDKAADAVKAAAAATQAAKDAEELTKETKVDKTKDDEEKDDDKEEKDDKDEKKREPRIPLSRHKALLEKERSDRATLEAKLAQYEHGEDVSKLNEELTKAEDTIVTLEGEYAKLLADGKTTEAAKVMAEIRKTERGANQKRNEMVAAASEARAYERARYDTVVERVEAAFPVLNPDNKDEFDSVAAQKVMRMAKSYQMDGLTPSAALQEAVKDILGEPATKKQTAAVEVTPKVSDAEVKAA